MSQYFYVEVSPGSPGSPPSIEDAAFLPFGDPLLDTGVEIDFDHYVTSSPGVIAGVLYAYKTRRYDDATGLFSSFSPVVFARAPIPYQESINMSVQDGILDSLINGSEIEVGIGIETREGFAVKVTKKLEVSSVSIKRAIGKLYAQVLRNAPTMRSKYVAGVATLEGPLSVMATPEGGFLHLLNGMLPDTVTGSSSPYTHTFPNAFGGKSFTLVVKIGQYLFVYAGCRVQSMQFDNLAGEPTAPVMANTQIVALNVVVYDTVADAGAYARTGMDVAAADTLPPYSGVHLVSFLNGSIGTVRTASLTISKQYEPKKGMNGKTGRQAHAESKTDIQLSASCYYEDLSLQLLDMGQAQNATLPVGPNNVVLLAPFTMIFSPPANGGGIVNTLVFGFPNCVVEVSENVNDEKAVAVDVTFSTIDVAGDPAGTDFYMSVANAVSAAPTVGAPIPNFPLTAMTPYFSAAVNSTPAPSTTVFKGDANNVASHSTVANDPVMLAKSVYFLTGLNAGLSRRISAYAAPTGGLGGQYTTAAFPQAPAAGDLFCVV